ENDIDPNVDGFLKEMMLKNSVPWIPFNELEKNIQTAYIGKVIIIYSAEWTYSHKYGVRTRKVRLDLLTESVNHEMLLNEVNI
ncbi:10913_t:CDS:1, partial [Gigaspora margarita]